MSYTTVPGAVLLLILCSTFFKGSLSATVVGFNDTLIYVQEDAAAIPIKLTSTGHQSVRVAVGYMTPGIGNATSGVDYNPVRLHTLLYHFPSPSSTSGSKNATGILINDDVVEATECFQINMTVNIPSDVVLSPQFATVCITNDDKVQFNFLYSNMTVEENKRYISIPVNKTGRSTIPVSFKLTMDEKSYSTATRGDDYQDRHGDVITFPASDQQLSTMYVNVSIKMDGKAESSEVFVVGLEVVDSGTATIGAMNSMVVKITDKKDNDDYAAKERQRQKDEDANKRIDNLLLILYIAIALVAVTLIIFIVILVLVIKRSKN